MDTQESLPYRPSAYPNTQSGKGVVFFTRKYEILLVSLVSLIPISLALYLYVYQDPLLLYVDHTFHEAAISVAILQSCFVGYVTWRCYESSGEPQLRWLTLSFIGFTLVYGLHGVFTPISHDHMALFLLYGPASRLLMAGCLLAGLLTYGTPYHEPSRRTKKTFWLNWILVFIVIDFLVGWFALTQLALIQPIRIGMEVGAILLILTGTIFISFRRIQSWMMVLYVISLAYFAQSSLIFIFAKPWNHLWWLAHVISATGFTILSFGVIRAFHTTKAFSLVFSQEEVMNQLASEKALSENNAIRFKGILDNLSAYVALLDMKGIISEVNKAALLESGYERTDVIGKHFYDLSLWSSDNKLRTKLIESIDFAKRGISNHFEAEVNMGQTTESIEFQISPIHDDNDIVTSLLATGIKITERKKAEEWIRIAAAAFETNEAIMITDSEANIIRVNQAFENLTGYKAAEVIGKNPRILQSGRHDREFYKSMWDSLKKDGIWIGEIWDKSKNGTLYLKQSTITSIKNEDGNVRQYVSMFTDITARKKAEEEVEQLAFYDPLTGLANRRMLLDRLKHSLASNVRNEKHGAIMFADLDNFKNLNDTKGHSVGDQLLIEVGVRLKKCVREQDTVARFGGDEFVILVENLSSNHNEALANADKLARKILHEISLPYLINGTEYYSSSSIGVTMYCDSSIVIDDLLKHADAAMYQSKKAGRNTVRFFNPESQTLLESRSLMEHELRHALKNNELVIHYQVQVNEDGLPIGAEALLRWDNPTLGKVSPGEFIPVAEDTGLIVPIGEWVLQTACKQIKLWENNFKTNYFELSVNISNRQFREEGFINIVRTIIEKNKINPSKLKLEITESLIMDDVEFTIQIINELKAIGIRFSMDDFGTGYSSLSNLKRIPLDQIKIDQSFVRDISTSNQDRSIVRTIIAMANSLELEIIAEGVETEEQRKLLINKGCCNFQGYLFSKPVPIEEFDALLKLI